MNSESNRPVIMLCAMHFGIRDETGELLNYTVKLAPESVKYNDDESERTATLDSVVISRKNRRKDLARDGDQFTEFSKAIRTSVTALSSF